MNLWKIFLVVAFLIVAPAMVAAGAPPAPDPGMTTVFLVRHAEKSIGESDPGLTEAGRARAAELVSTLRDAGIEHILSSDYRRTRDTAAPLAAALGLVIEIYDPRDLPGLVVRLRELDGRALVVGHSNTTPAVVELLGGEPGPPIDDATEHDRLYVLCIGGVKTVSTALIRYGAH